VQKSTDLAREAVNCNAVFGGSQCWSITGCKQRRLPGELRNNGSSRLAWPVEEQTGYLGWLLAMEKMPGAADTRKSILATEVVRLLGH
jgi:hypothetical protein